MRQLIAVTPDNSNLKAVENGSSRRWNNQAYGSVNTGTDPLRFQSRGYGQPLQSHLNLKNSDVKINQTCGTIPPKGLEYLHLFKLDISIRKMCVFQFGKNLSNVKISNNKCVSELRTYHGTYCKTLRNDKLMNYSNANPENNSNVKGNNGLDQIPDSSEADLENIV
ncbi:hypothetical protein TNCT_411471 [Trichonephila clavata]|uniref:Uncharacterized protein n=1 Tax=Trichonephila clavata TaxID=2740835 RepID=A0A8X6L9U8_TRICU|nr:hypothetical protein TNCT_411471 [Trichonephila clavata]